MPCLKPKNKVLDKLIADLRDVCIQHYLAHKAFCMHWKLMTFTERRLCSDLADRFDNEVWERSAAFLYAVREAKDRRYYRDKFDALAEKYR